MAQNPSYNPTSGPSMNTAPTNVQNLDQPIVKKTHNAFDLSYFHYKTQSYGRYEPFFVMPVTPADRIKYANGFDLYSPNLASPLMVNLYQNRDYFYVPMTAILPNSWEYIYTNPSQGDDVPDDANTVIKNFRPLLFNYFKRVIGSLSRPDIDLNSYNFSHWISRMLILELFFSTGSLLYNMGYKLSVRFKSTNIHVGFNNILARSFTNFRKDANNDTFRDEICHVRVENSVKS